MLKILVLAQISIKNLQQTFLYHRNNFKNLLKIVWNRRHIIIIHDWKFMRFIGLIKRDVENRQWNCKQTNYSTCFFFSLPFPDHNSFLSHILLLEKFPYLAVWNEKWTLFKSHNLIKKHSQTNRTILY